MYKRILLALDLEGVNFVVGEPYSGLSKNTEQWCIAKKQAVAEVNAAAEALFDAGVEVVALFAGESYDSGYPCDHADRQGHRNG